MRRLSLFNALPKYFLRFASPLFCCLLIMMQTQISYFVEKVSIEGNEMYSVISKTSAFGGNENYN